VCVGKPEPLVSKKPCQQISQPVSRKNHPPISNPARTMHVSRRKHGGCLNVSAVLISTFRNPNLSSITVSNLRRNLEALFHPRFKVSARKFGELAALKLLPVSECRGFVSQPCQIRGAGPSVALPASPPHRFHSRPCRPWDTQR
jgi:hypothetical protein